MGLKSTRVTFEGRGRVRAPQVRGREKGRVSLHASRRRHPRQRPTRSRFELRGHLVINPNPNPNPNENEKGKETEEVLGIESQAGQKQLAATSMEFSMFEFWTAVGIHTFRASAAAAKFLRGMGGARSPHPFVPGCPHTPRTPTSNKVIESCLYILKEKKQAWAQASSAEKAELLEKCLANMVDVADDVAKVTVKVKGSYESGLGEELAAWSSCCNIVRETIKAVKADYKPSGVKTRLLKESNQVVCETFPRGLMGLVFLGMKGEVWLQPGKEFKQGRPESSDDGSLWLVLGAGNQVPALVGDITHCMFMCNSTVILKMNPVNDFLGSMLEASFEPLISKGYLQIVYGGAEVGKTLVEHPLTEEIHMTGSDRTFDAITWQGKQKPKDKKTIPPFTKPIHAELGCVTPYIILPGNWSKEDLDSQAKQCVSGKTHNSGHNCVALEVLILPENWHLREKFMERIKFHLEKSEKRVAWYPHSKSNYERFLSKFPEAHQFGEFNEETGQTPWVLASGLTPETAGAQSEHWCGVLQEVRVKSRSLADYVEQVADFCNNKLWGDLSCAVFVDPKTQKRSKAEVDYLIRSLKYGGIAVNLPTHIAFAIPTLTWGGYPGHTIYDIQSGNACVHNTSCLLDTQKSVIYGPWKAPIYPVWNYDNINLENTAKGLVKFFAYPNIANMAALAMQAMFGTP